MPVSTARRPVFTFASRAAFGVYFAALATSCDSSAAAPAPFVQLEVVGTPTQITQGNNVTRLVKTTRYAYAGDLALEVTGLPAGVTANFTSPTAREVTLTLTATITATPGEVTVTVRATGLELEPATTTFTLTVLVAGSYTLSVMSPLPVAQGTVGSTAVTVNRVGGFAQGVALSISALPAGVTASFAPPTATTAPSVLSFTVASSAPVGTFTMTITGTTPGLPSQTVDVQLVIHAPSPPAGWASDAPQLRYRVGATAG
jgi:hypothetical protein